MPPARTIIFVTIGERRTSSTISCTIVVCQARRSIQIMLVSRAPRVPRSRVNNPQVRFLLARLQTGGQPETPLVLSMPGSRTAVIRLKPGEDANQVAAGQLANPETLFGTNRDTLASLQDFRAPIVYDPCSFYGHNEYDFRVLVGGRPTIRRTRCYRMSMRMIG